MAYSLNHLHLKTTDPEATSRFYVEVLGARMVRKGANGYAIDLHGLPINVTTFVKEQTREQTLGMEHLALSTAEYEKDVAALRARGVAILEEAINTAGLRTCFIEGPDGVELQVVEVKA